MNCLQIAIYNKHSDVVEILLKKASTSGFFTFSEKTWRELSISEFLQTPRKNGITTLQTAIISQDLKIIKLLLKLGADINQIDLKS